jgi:hypothetical protein
MKRSVSFSLLIFVLGAMTVVFPALSIRAQAADSLVRVSVPRYRARLLGVYDAMSGEPVSGARVIEVTTGTFTETGSSGAVVLTFLPEGASLVRVQKIGYEPQTLVVEVSPAATNGLTIVLRRVQELPAVVTKDTNTVHLSPMLRGFEARKKSEAGYFITEAQLRKNDGRLLANVLTALAPGMVINRSRGTRSLLMASPQCMDGSHAGPPAVYLDGVPLAAIPAAGGRGVSSADTAPFDLSLFDVTDLAAVEWYPSSARTPMEFNHTSSRCGALLLWTRER